MRLVICLSSRGEELCRHFVDGEVTFDALHLPRNEWHIRPVRYVIHEVVEFA